MKLSIVLHWCAIHCGVLFNGVLCTGVLCTGVLCTPVHSTGVLCIGMLCTGVLCTGMLCTSSSTCAWCWLHTAQLARARGPHHYLLLRDKVRLSVFLSDWQLSCKMKDYWWILHCEMFSRYSLTLPWCLSPVCLFVHISHTLRILQAVSCLDLVDRNNTNYCVSWIEILLSWLQT